MLLKHYKSSLGCQPHNEVYFAIFILQMDTSSYVKNNMDLREEEQDRALYWCCYYLISSSEPRIHVIDRHKELDQLQTRMFFL